MTIVTQEQLPLEPAAVQKLLDETFPEAREQVGDVEIMTCGQGHAVVRLPYEAHFARPGGTISGPTMFQLADMAAYVAILSDLGLVAVDAVTTTMTINFLARPAPAALLCEIDILRRGRRQVVCDARLFSEPGRALVAQASSIYALPATR